MKIQSLYLDTSIIGGYFDVEFKQPTRELWRQMERGIYRFFVSPITLREISRAPRAIRILTAATFANPASILPLTPEAITLSDAYLKAKVVPARYAEDADHVAIAVVHHIDFVVSWNFKHLVNVRRNDAFNKVNRLKSYPSVRIVNPLELIYG